MDRYQAAMLFLAGVAAFIHLALRRSYRWSKWARNRVPRLGGGRGWGTVYVFQDRAVSRLVKVGTTQRMSKTRKGEVSRTMADGGGLVQVYAIDMPYARAVETLSHRKLRRHRAKVGRGREWFWAGENGEIEHIIAAIKQAAADIREIAVRRRRWDDDMDARAREVFISGRQLVKPLLFVPKSSVPS